MFNVKEEAIALLSKYFGSQVATLYSSYYKEKNDEFIISSLEKLLKGFIGDEKTATEISRFSKTISN